MPRRAGAIASACIGFALFHPSAVRAAPVCRAFEPTDMELDGPGVMELDMQYGLVRGHDAYRVSTPDFELGGVRYSKVRLW